MLAGSIGLAAGSALPTVGGLLTPETAEASTPGGPLSQSVLQADAVYFPETGHTVAGAFWQHWSRYGLDGFGYPITEAFEHGGVLNQYFQRARFELTPQGTVRLGLLGIEVGGEAPAGEGVELTEDMIRAPETGHTVAGAFLAAYRQLREVLGPPVGPEQVSGTGYIQYFANARLEWDPFGGTRLGLLGSEIAAQRGIDTAPVAAPSGMMAWSEYTAAMAADEAERRAFAARLTGTGFVPAPGQRWIYVSLAQQRVYAYQHTTQAFTDVISSGHRDKGLSTRGVFAINRRIPNETMDSTTIGYPRGHPKYYRLENVLYTQYYYGGEAIHYAWWHSNFGQPMSYGCINMRLNTARWFWDWATFGTPVVVA